MHIGNTNIRKRGVVWGLWGAVLFMLFPIAIDGVISLKEHVRYMDFLEKPGEEFVNIEWIAASDIGHDGIQYMEMCRWVDKERASEWTWELSLIRIDASAANGTKKQRVYSSAQDAIIETTEDCLIAWSSKGDPEYSALVQSLDSGRYQWDVHVDFKVEYQDKIIPKSVAGSSNIFTKRVTLIEE